MYRNIDVSLKNSWFNACSAALVVFFGVWAGVANAEQLNDKPLAGDAFLAAEAALAAIAENKFGNAVLEARRARALAPASEFAARLLVDALSKASRSAEAIGEAETAIAQGGASGQLLAQLGYLTQTAGDMARAVDHFTEALSAGGLSTEQDIDVGNALENARFTPLASRAYAAVARGDHSTALGLAREALRTRPGNEAMILTLVDSLVQMGRSSQALLEADSAISRGYATPQLLAQRGYLRLKSGFYDGAEADFRAAAASGVIRPAVAAQLRYTIAEARSSAAEDKGNTEIAIQIWRNYLDSAPSDANGWFSLGYLLIRSDEDEKATVAFETGLEFSRRGDILLQLGAGYTKRSAPKASSYLREALDANRASDPSLADLTDHDRERLRNQITQSDDSVRTTFGGSLSQTDVGTFVGIETALRFDGRYLPSASGLEAYMRGSWSQEENKTTEIDLAIGLRWRPFENTDFVLAGEWQHRIDPAELDQLVINWGYSRGGIAHPYEKGTKFFSTVGAFGSWRLGEERYLQNVAGAVGISYSKRSPFRYVISPSIALDASYDSFANDHRFALGVGPALTFNTWLGGNNYSGYDFAGQMQVKYLTPIGPSDRQSGWQLSFGVTF